VAQAAVDGMTPHQRNDPMTAVARTVLSRASASRRGLICCLLVAFAGLSACGDDAATAPAPAAETAAPAPAAPTPTAPATAPAAPATPDVSAASLIGRIVPPYPDGLGEIAGSCVPTGDGSVRICDYSLAMVGTAAADGGAAMARYLLASRRSNPDADKPTWEVLDAADAPRVEPGYDLQLGACRLDDRDDPGLIAVVRHGDAEGSTDVRWARRFDVAAGKLVDVDAARVSCTNPGAGV
jgi:hypothetical protein